MRSGLIAAAIAACAAAFLGRQVTAQDCYTVGTWNLEHFSASSHSRGFPELHDTLPPRTPAQLDLLAAAIRDRVGAKILVLNEINGRPGQATSAELEDLVTRLGPSWRQAIDKSGRDQRVAIIWDSTDVEEIARLEISIPEERIGTGDDATDIFARDPLAVYFRFLKGGQARNDLLVVGLHLASGQHLTENHDAAMKKLRDKLRSLRGHSPILPQAEDDILLAGDLNANPFDNNRESFFTTFNRGNWRLLASGPDYPATRINGSKIDYIIVTRKNDAQSGLFGEEIETEDPTVHHELAPNGPDEYRQDYTDHFAVTTCIAVTHDSD